MSATGKDEIIEARQRRAALIATASAVPLTVLLAFVFSAGHSGSGSNESKPVAAASATVTITPPPPPTDAIARACTTVIAGLPVQLAGLDARKYDSNSSFVAAWGQPAVILRCGVKRVNPNNPNNPGLVGIGYDSNPRDIISWLPTLKKSEAVYTTVDRGSTVVEVTVPQGQDPSSVLAPISKAVAQLPATCSTTDHEGNKSSNKDTCDGTN